MTRGRVSIPDLAIEGNLTRDQVRDYIYDLIGKDLFRGYVNWDKGELVSAEAAQIKDGTCPNCGGQLELAGKGLVRCPFCGTETYLSPPGAPAPTCSAPATGATPGSGCRGRDAAARSGAAGDRHRSAPAPPPEPTGRSHDREPPRADWSTSCGWTTGAGPSETAPPAFWPAWRRRARCARRRRSWACRTTRPGGSSTPPSSVWAFLCSTAASAAALGGGSHITPEAQDLMRRYRALAAEADDGLWTQVFQRHFADWEDPQPAGAEPAAPTET